jgi:peptide/nickel transport system substrate-binding protein
VEDSNTPPLEPADQPMPVETISDTIPTSPAAKRGKLKWLLTVIVLILLTGCGYLAWTHFHKADENKVATTIKDIPLLRIGSPNGPIGSAYIFPNAPGIIASQIIDFQIFEGLIGFKNNAITPLLATSWTNPDKTTWVFKLAHDIKFQNGDTMTAVDVADSLSADLQNDNWSSYLSTTSTVKATGTDEVTITTSQPDALLLNRLVYGFVFKKDAAGKYYGTGPYSLDKTKPDTESTTSLVAFEDYHGGHPKVKAQTYTIYEKDTNMVADFKAKKIDTFDDNVSPKTQAEFGSAAKVFTYQDPGAYGINLAMRRPGTPLTDIRVREAIAYAIDRPALVKQSVDPITATQYIIPQTVVGYDSTAKFPGLDVAKSKQLQVAAGYPGGVPLTFAYVKGYQLDAPVLIQQLEAAGFTITPDAVTSTDDIISGLKSNKDDLSSITFDSNYYDATDMFTQLLDSKQSAFPFYANPQLDTLINTAEQEFNPAAHIKKAQAITKFVADNYLWIPVRSTETSIYSIPNYKILQNYQTTPEFTNYWQVGQVVTTTPKSK